MRSSTIADIVQEGTINRICIVSLSNYQIRIIDKIGNLGWADSGTVRELVEPEKRDALFSTRGRKYSRRMTNPPIVYV